MRLLIALIILCIVFPGLGTLFSNGVLAFVPLLEAFMPCLIIIVGLYLIVKSVLR